MGVLSNHEPKNVLKFFEELCQIPHGSGNEKAVSDYLKAFALERGLSVVQDEVLNILIKKPGTPGYESSPAVILQGHMDMVEEKNADTDHVFGQDPLKLRLLGDDLYATGTTLGADNGIAVAYALAILDAQDLEHPPLEVLITVEEETGMLGASSVDGRLFAGKRLVNIDSEEEGAFLVSCAGGARQTVKLPLTRQTPSGEAFELKVRGLKGGHSGMDIMKERGNSIVLLGRALMLLRRNFDFTLASISGGSKNNAIPREAQAVILLTSSAEGLAEKVASIGKILGREIETQDENFALNLEAANMPDTAFDAATTQSVLELLNLLPNGVVSMSQDIPGLVETSLNLGVLHEKEEILHFDFAVRSSVGSRKEMLLDKVQILGEKYGAEVVTTSSYPEWTYAKESPLREMFVKKFEEMYGHAPKIEAIHAGLECGILAGRIPGLDMISLGPNLYDVHTPNEHMNLESVRNVYGFLLEVLASLKS